MTLSPCAQGLEAVSRELVSPCVTAAVCASVQRLGAPLEHGFGLFTYHPLPSQAAQVFPWVILETHGAGDRGVGMLPAPLMLSGAAWEAGVALGCAVPCAGAGSVPTRGILVSPGSSAQGSRGQHRGGMHGHEAARGSGAGKGTVVWMCRWGGLGPSAASIERITHKWAGGPVWISPASSLGNLCMGETQLSRFMAALA